MFRQAEWGIPMDSPGNDFGGFKPSGSHIPLSGALPQTNANTSSVEPKEPSRPGSGPHGRAASIPADRAGQLQSLTVSTSVKWRQPCLLGHAVDRMDRVWKGFVVDQVPARFLREAAAVTAGATLSPSFSSLGLGWPPQAWACPYTL